MSLRKKKEKSDIEKEIDYLLELMKSVNPITEQYYTLLERVRILKELRLKEQEKEKEGKVRPDTWIQAAVSIGGLLLVLNYEQARFIGNKAWQWIRRV